MRILALDFGSKRIGVALSDELYITAQGMDTIYRKDIASDLEFIKKLVTDNNVMEVVVGLPLNMNGTHSQKTEEVLKFVDILSEALKAPVKTWDERLTSMAAEKALIEADMSRYKRRHLTDKLAAQLILQGYLDSRKRGVL